MDIQERLKMWAAAPAEVNDDDRKHLCQIRYWVMQLCHKKQLELSDIFVSAFPQPSDNGEVRSVTLICIVDNLPESPIVTIGKAPAEVTVEDLMGCYKLFNFCCE